MPDDRALLKSAFAHAIKACDGYVCVAEKCKLSSFTGAVYILALGKASGPMHQAARDRLGTQLKRSLVISLEPVDTDPQCINLISDHPYVTERSFVAGAKVLEFVDEIPPGSTLLVLLSGGASAMCEALPESVGYEAFRDLGQYLLQSNLAIDEVNAVRQSLSLIKNGRLAKHVKPSINIVQWLLSDVADDDIAIIGSGPFVERASLTLPPLTQSIVRMVALAQTQLARFTHVPMPEVQTSVLAGNSFACRAVADWAKSKNLPISIRSAYGEIQQVAADIFHEVQNGNAGLWVFGGETHLNLPRVHGKGGRNQHLALMLAVQFAQQSPITALCAGTDGKDGTQDVAGAVFNAKDLDLTDALQALDHADSYHWWKQRDGLLLTGPTRTNVADLTLVLKN